MEAELDPDTSPVLHVPNQQAPCQMPGTVASSSGPQNLTVDSDIRVMGWNVGGADLAELPKAVRNALGDKGKRQDLVLLQEVPREREGWSYTHLEGVSQTSIAMEGHRAVV